MKTTLLYLTLCTILAWGELATTAADTPRWWRGNLHAHSLWSDGDDFPEMIAELYKHNGYHFLAFTDHNTLQLSNKWVNVLTQRGLTNAFPKYAARWPKDWVETRTTTNRQTEVRLKPLPEYRSRVEEPGRFLLLQSEEITDRWKFASLHLNAHNLRELVKPAGGSNVLEILQNNVNAVLEQRQRTGQPMFPHVNHPNFGLSIMPEELMRVRGLRFFEVYNGHPAAQNGGFQGPIGPPAPPRFPSLDRLWDIALTRRLTELQLEVLYGLATDDSHDYHTSGGGSSAALRGWVWVRAPQLTPEHLITALEAGDFYASTGVKLRELRQSPSEITLEIEPQPKVSYVTQFIGTRHGYDARSEPRLSTTGEPLRLAHNYSKELGATLAVVKGTRASYRLKGDEIYVRAKIISTKVQANPSQAGDVETAWVQPIGPGIRHR